MEDLQSLLEKINRDGVEKADAEAKRIVDEAKAKADALVKAARDEAAKLKADAEQAATDSAARAAQTIGQAARDVIAEVREKVTALLTRLLAEDVDRALADPAATAALAADAIRELAGPGEVVCGAKLAAALKAQLAASSGFTVVLDESVGSGFTVTCEGGRVEHAFTGEVIAAELAKRLRPDLAKLVG